MPFFHVTNKFYEIFGTCLCFVKNDTETLFIFHVGGSSVKCTCEKKHVSQFYAA